MPKWWTSIPPPSPEEEVGRKHWTKQSHLEISVGSGTVEFRFQIQSSHDVVQCMAGSIEGCCGGFWICQAEKGQSQETQGRWLYLQKIWPPQTKKLWIACIIRLLCAMRPKQWGLNMFKKKWVWTLDRTALCRACHPFGSVSQLRCLLCLQKKMLTNWVSPQNDIVCDCVCARLFRNHVFRPISLQLLAVWLSA